MSGTGADGPAAPGRSGASSVRAVAIATVIVAVAGYVVIFLAARVLGPTLSGIFMVFWSALYLAVGTVFGLQQESTRAVRTTAQTIADFTHPRVFVAAICAGAAIAVVVAVSSPFWAVAAFGDNAVLFTVLVVVGALLYSGHAAVAGALAGLNRWNSFSVLLVTEALLRAGLVGAVLAVSHSVPWLAVVSVFAMGAWLLLLAHPTYRVAIRARSDAGLRTSVLRMLQGAIAAASSAAIITGFPLLLSFTDQRDDPALLGVVILVVTFTRGPILVPLNAFLGMLVARFVDDMDGALQLVLRGIGALLLATAVVSGVAFLIGEEVFVVVLGEAYRIGGAFIAGCVIAAGLIGAMNIAGAAVLARGYHTSYSTAWLAAALGAVAVLLMPLPLDVRVVAALTAGPVLGIALHLFALVRRR